METAILVILIIIFLSQVLIVLGNRKFMKQFGSDSLINPLLSIEKMENNIRDEFSRNRTEANSNAKDTREEFQKSYEESRESELELENRK